MRETFQTAHDCQNNDTRNPVIIVDFTRLRDVLILKFIIVSLKWAVEFSEFSLVEYTKTVASPMWSG